MHIKRSKVSTKAGTMEYLSLVESYRINGKKKNRTVMSLGRSDTVDEGQIQKIIFGLSRLTTELSILKKRSPEDSDVKIYESMDFGVTLVIEQFWKELEFSGLMKKIQKKYPKLQFDLELVFKANVMYRLIKPGSERKMMDWFQDVYLPGVEKLQIQHLYRGLKIISDHKTEIEKHLLEKSRTLFGIDCSLVFFDTTSTYFDGDRLDDEALKQYGRSKDHRPDRKQIKIGMVMSRDGMPIHCSFFPGNESDFSSVPYVLDALKTEAEDIGEMIFVADSGMTSAKNIEEIKRQNMQYILGSRMRSSKEIKEKILTEEDISLLTDTNKNTEYQVKKNLFVMEKKREKTIEQEGKKNQKQKNQTDTNQEKNLESKKRYIICYNPEEAKKDKAVRTEIIEKLTAEINGSPKKYMKHRLHKRFLKITKVTTEIDTEKILEEEKYDGLFVIETDTNLSASEVALKYKDLLLVERGFRYLKSTLDMRPIYHQSSENIQGHIFINFIALYFFCLMMKKFDEAEENRPCEEGQILDSLARLKVHKTEIHGERLILRSEINALNSQILKSLNVKTPNQILKKW